jgi:hydroxyacylglutathione hydrolase
MVQYKKYILGPFQNNSYLIIPENQSGCAIIDPAIGCQKIIADLKKSGLGLSQIWITHAHFDHVAGIETLMNAFGDSIPIYMYPLDLRLWEDGGGIREIGLTVDIRQFPSLPLDDNQILPLGSDRFRVLHTPGHTSGHVVFHCADEKLAFCGDLIFQNSIGRTDLENGNFETIIQSIKTRIFTLPNETRLLCGHGPETTVECEKKGNPYFKNTGG